MRNPPPMPITPVSAPTESATTYNATDGARWTGTCAASRLAERSIITAAAAIAIPRISSCTRPSSRPDARAPPNDPAIATSPNMSALDNPHVARAPMPDRTHEARGAHHRKAHRDGELGVESEDVHEHRHRENRSAAAEQAERESDDECESKPDGDHVTGRAGDTSGAAPSARRSARRRPRCEAACARPTGGRSPAVRSGSPLASYPAGKLMAGCPVKFDGKAKRIISVVIERSDSPNGCASGIDAWRDDSRGGRDDRIHVR